MNDNKMEQSRSYAQNRPVNTNTPRYTPGTDVLLPQLAHMRDEDSRAGTQRRRVHPALAQLQAQHRPPPTQVHPAFKQNDEIQNGSSMMESVTPIAARQGSFYGPSHIRERGGHGASALREPPAATTNATDYVYEPEKTSYPTNDPRKLAQAQLQQHQTQLQPKDLTGSARKATPHASLILSSAKRLPETPVLTRTNREPSDELRHLPPAHTAKAKSHTSLASSSPEEDAMLALAHLREAQRLLTPVYLRSEETATEMLLDKRDGHINPTLSIRDRSTVSAAERYYARRRRSSHLEKRANDEDHSGFPGDEDSDLEELEPQASTSPDDPLNWSWKKKHAVLLALIPGCLLSDWTLTWGTTVFELQAPEWQMSLPAVAQSVSPGIFMQGPGGILAVPLCQRYGRLPVLFWSQLLSLAFTIGATLAPTYASFTAMRTLQGFFGAAPQVIGLSMIHDMFFFHERTRKINIWAASFLIGPYLGPFFSSLLLLKIGWRPDFGVLCGFYGLSLLMVILLGDETLFDRAGMHKLPPGHIPTLEKQPFSMKRHITQLLVGIPSRRRCPSTPSLWRVFSNQCYLLTRPALLIPTALFVTPITMWTIGMVSTVSMFVLPPPPYGFGFSYVALAMLYLAPMIGTLLAEAWGHWFNDLLARRHPNRQPEFRLLAVYPAGLIGCMGLILYGQVLQRGLHWIGLAFGWAMTCFCTLACMTAISAYTLDCFPDHAALASAWINFWRVVGGFAVIYFQLDWVHRNGPAMAFGCQALVVGGAMLTVLATQWWGKTWRDKFPPPKAEN